MVVHTLIALAEFNFSFGIIGIDEYVERCEIARWLDDESDTLPDPRGGHVSGENRAPNGLDSIERDEESPIFANSKNADPDLFELLLLKRWLFTRSDPDPYPSTPHGHFQKADRKWPKLNPYTGRVFKEKHQEDVSQRLTKKDMNELWNDIKFRDFCRSYILWYQEAFPKYKFQVPRPLRFPRWP